MSSNKTPNYNLHSWAAGDDFRFHEVNENFTKVDGAIKAEAQAAAQGRATLAALAREALHMVSGKYAGTKPRTDSTKHTINIGAKPRAVLIGTTSGYNPYTSGSYGGLATREHPMGGLTLTDTGFTVANGSPYANESGVNYIYLALI